MSMKTIGNKQQQKRKKQTNKDQELTIYINFSIQGGSTRLKMPHRMDIVISKLQSNHTSYILYPRSFS